MAIADMLVQVVFSLESFPFVLLLAYWAGVATNASVARHMSTVGIPTRVAFSAAWFTAYISFVSRRFGMGFRAIER